jgi:hypothetical protein
VQGSRGCVPWAVSNSTAGRGDARYLLVLVHVNIIKISNEFLSFVGEKWLWYEMTASTDYVPLLLNYFPLFVMVGDDLTCNGIQLLFRFL